MHVLVSKLVKQVQTTDYSLWFIYVCIGRILAYVYGFY